MRLFCTNNDEHKDVCCICGKIRMYVKSLQGLIYIITCKEERKNEAKTITEICVMFFDEI